MEESVARQDQGEVTEDVISQLVNGFDLSGLHKETTEKESKSGIPKGSDLAPGEVFVSRNGSLRIWKTPRATEDCKGQTFFEFFEDGSASLPLRKYWMCPYCGFASDGNREGHTTVLLHLAKAHKIDIWKESLPKRVRSVESRTKPYFWTEPDTEPYTPPKSTRLRTRKTPKGSTAPRKRKRKDQGIDMSILDYNAKRKAKRSRVYKGEEIL